MYKIVTKNSDRDGKIFYLKVNYCFTLSEAKNYIKKKGNRERHYLIQHEGKFTHECKPKCFAAREIK